MKTDEVTLLVNTAFSIVELIVRLQQENPGQFADQHEKIAELKRKLNSLADKPDDYLQQWDV
jgi:hypothetical protein